MIAERFSARAARRLDWPCWSRRLATSVYFLVLNWLLLTSASTFDDVGEFVIDQDKIAHLGVFLLLALLVRWSLPAGGRTGRRGLLAVAALLVYAAAIEKLQPLLGGEGREFDWLDMAGNLAGVCCGWLLYGKAAGYHGAGSSRVKPTRGAV